MSSQDAHSATGQRSAVTASALDTARVLAEVVAPTLAGGVIKRRPRGMALSERFQLDRAGSRLLTRLRERYDGRPIRLRVPGRSITVLLDHEDVGRVLEGTPAPFTPASLEKKAALRHFQPHGVLISEENRRAERREVNERALEPGRELHELAGVWAPRIRSHAVGMATPRLGWQRFQEHWWQLVRELTLGGDTDEDRAVTEMLDVLREDANWAYARPRRKRLRAEFLDLVHRQVALNRPGSLAAALNATPAPPGTDPAGQVPHWLFAFDAAGMASFRTLALLATHPEAAERARGEAVDLDRPRPLPYLRACVRESLRLWPTTPALLREAVWDTPLGREEATVLTCTPFFHRDAERLPYANRFEPDIWLDGRASTEPALVPFSAGPGACPGRNLVLFVTSTLLANLLHGRRVSMPGTHWDPEALPATLDHFRLRFAFSAV